MIFRYPGGKKRVARHLAQALLPYREFREPFFGSGAVTFAALTDIIQAPDRVWINDKDKGIAALWTSVIRDPVGLCAKVAGFRPSVQMFRDFKESLLDPDRGLSELDIGFRKLAVHQMSFSGLGVKAGSPIGGWDQDPANPPKYDVGCRWNPEALVGKIQWCHRLLVGRCHEDRCTTYDALTVIQAPGDGVSIYVDPPYVKAGEELYLHAYREDDHRDLARVLLASPHRWLLSYDDHPLVRELYRDRPVHHAEWAYTINSQETNPGRELLVLGGAHLPVLRGKPEADAEEEPDEGIMGLFGSS